MKLRVKISELSVLIGEKPAQTNGKKVPKWQRQKQAERVQVSKSLNQRPAPTLEIQLLGYTVHEAIPEVEAFIDAAVIANLEEVRIVHGMGTGKLRAGIHEFLRTHKNVAEFRLGRYGEGETGVTIVKIK
jgi:DNA mismatch repair protein MutS2